MGVICVRLSAGSSVRSEEDADLGVLWLQKGGPHPPGLLVCRPVSARPPGRPLTSWFLALLPGPPHHCLPLSLGSFFSEALLGEFQIPTQESEDHPMALRTSRSPRDACRGPVRRPADRRCSGRPSWLFAPWALVSTRTGPP